MVLTKEEFIEKLDTLTTAMTDDVSLESLTDIKETIDHLYEGGVIDLDAINAEHDEELKALDDSWRTKYRNAVLHGETDEEESKTESEEKEETKPQSYADLFEESED